ncbi:MAG: YceI family protein [Gemmatimonadaceae bacterium]|nr:YceI family protein [Gemmatimonadaceae bacterium]
MRSERLRWMAWLAVIPLGIAMRAPFQPVTLKAESKLWFDGTSTVRSWSCKAPVIDAAIDANAAPIAKPVLAGEKAVQSAKLVFPVAKLECGNGTMNEHMRKALKAEANPTIAFAVRSYELAKGATATSGTLSGALTIAGMERPVTVQAQFAEGAVGALRVTGSYDLKMTEWGVTPPKLMLGTLKVGESVKVSFDLLLQ